MKKIIIVGAVLFAAGVATYCLFTGNKPVSKDKVTVVAEEKEKEVEIKTGEDLEEKVSEEIKTDIQNEELQEDLKEEISTIQPSKEESKKEESSKPVVVTSPSKEEVKKEENSKKPSDNTTETKIEINNVSTAFYDSITHRKKEFSSEEEALKRGYEIQNKEYDYVFDYNDAHPESPIEVDINYFRVYPSVIDENGKTWYYLHFFCKSGEGNDEKLKSKF